MDTPLNQHQALSNNLRSLLLVRGVFLLSVVVALAYCYLTLQLPLAYASMLWIVTALTIISALSIALLPQERCTPRMFFAQLMIDVLGVSSLLFFSGGADNPFVSYYLVPLCIAAATLSGRATGILMISSLLLYTTLFFQRVPLPDLAPHHQHGANASFSIHSMGMWINFVLSALLISFFVVRMAGALRKQQLQLQQLREDNLRDEQLLALATLAAGTAHELGTPLTTIKTLVSELQDEFGGVENLGQDLGLLRSQVDLCSDNLRQLSERAAHLQAGTEKRDTPENLCRKVYDNWLLMRPEVAATFDVEPGPEIDVILHPTLLQAMANLLNNAADANPKDISVRLSWDNEAMSIDIYDRGPGIDPEIIAALGDPFNSSKGSGRGLGLFLTQAAIQRHGGSLKLEPVSGGGTHTQMTFTLRHNS